MCLSFGIITAYHIRLAYRVRCTPMQTSIGVTNHLRSKWALTFFNFTLAIRYFNHASFGLGIPDQTDGVANHDFMAGVINHAGFHYTLACEGIILPFLLASGFSVRPGCSLARWCWCRCSTGWIELPESVGFIFS